MMTIETLTELFNKYEDEYGKFERVENPLSHRPDLCAFIRLDILLPQGRRDIVSSAEHDQIYLGIELEELLQVITEEDVLYLTRCGVMLDTEVDSLSLFV